MFLKAFIITFVIGLCSVYIPAYLKSSGQEQPAQELSELQDKTDSVIASLSKRKKSVFFENKSLLPYTVKLLTDDKRISIEIEDTIVPAEWSMWLPFLCTDNLQISCEGHTFDIQLVEDHKSYSISVDEKGASVEVRPLRDNEQVTDTMSTTVLAVLMPYVMREIEEQYPIGSTIQGEVLRITEAGTFIGIRPGIEGVIKNEEAVLILGQKTEFVVNKIVKGDSQDTFEIRLELSLKPQALSEDQAQE